MSKFLVTGGAGFIGSHIVEFLLKKGHTVCILDNFSTGKKENLNFLKQFPKKQYQIIKGDIRNYKTCLKATNGAQYVLHQAACKFVQRSFKEPNLFNEVNINGTLNMLEASVQSKVKRFVYASSSSVYGDCKIFPQKEDQILSPLSPYGITKLAGEHYCRVYSHVYGLPTVCLRYFNVFGPRQPFKDLYSAVIVKFIKMMLENKRPIIYGDGGQSRDFTYVDNVVSANYLSATKTKNIHEVFNAALGNSIPVINLVKTLNKFTHQDIKPQFTPKRPGEIYKSQADISKIKRSIGFKGIVSFDEGIKKTLDYIQL